MATAEWEIPFTFTTPYGTNIGQSLVLNSDLGAIVDSSWEGRQFRCRPQGCVAKRSVRANTDDVPQGDGEIFHERFATGYEMTFAIQLWERFPSIGQTTDGKAACDEVRCEMRDFLYGHLWSLLRPPDDSGRVSWDPSCADSRLLDAIRLLAIEDPVEDDQGLWEVTATIDSPFPYAISLFEDVVTFSGTTTLTNDGNVDFYPVFKAHGATGAWSIENNDTGQLYLYESSRPGGQAIGGGDYAEVDMFRGGLIYLNGDEDNLKPNVDVEASDILTVAAGGSSYSANGASVSVLMHDAFA